MNYSQRGLNVKAKIVLFNIILLLLIISNCVCSYEFDNFFSLKYLVLSNTFCLIVILGINWYLVSKKLKITDNEFLRYNFCKNCAKNVSQIDVMLDNIFQTTPDIITFRDSKLRYAMCSKCFLDFFGYKSDNEVIGKTQLELFYSEQALLVDKYLHYVLKEKVSKTYIQKYYLNNVEYIYESTSSPIISNNEVVGIITLSRDITETIYLRKSLEYSNEKLYSLIDNSPLLAYVLDKDGNFILGNERAKDLFLSGIDVMDTGEKVKFDVDAMRDEILKENLELIATGKTLDVEKHIQAINGEKYWYKINKSPMKNNEGKYYAVTTFARNIDSEKRIQEQRETYIATLSHDLKTPTIAQIRALELLLSGQLGILNDEQKEMVKLTLDSCNYMYDMVYTLLSTCKFESGEVVLKYSSFDIVELIRESIHEISNLSKENSTDIIFSPGMDCFTVSADKIELKRVVINLISNAISYAFPNTEINVSVRIVDNFVELRVKNSSSYIEPDKMQRIFRKYVTHSEKYNKVGVGLGLYLSKKIVEAHEGKIIAESSKSQTNTFGFLIPVSNIKLESCQKEKYVSL